MTNVSATPDSEKIGFVPEWNPWDSDCTASCGSRIYKTGCARGCGIIPLSPQPPHRSSTQLRSSLVCVI